MKTLTQTPSERLRLRFLVDRHTKAPAPDDLMGQWDAAQQRNRRRAAIYQRPRKRAAITQ